MRMLLCVGWIIGISAVGQVTGSVTQGMFVCLIFVILGLLFLHQYIHAVYGKMLLALLITGLMSVVGFYHASAELQQRMQARERHTGDAEVLVYVSELNQLKEKSVQQPLWVLNRQAHVVRWQGSYRKSEKSEKVLEIGKYYQLSGKIRPAHSYAIAGAFDQEQWYLQQNLMANFAIEKIQPLSSQQVEALGYQQFVRQQQGIWSQFKCWVAQQRLQLREFLQQQPLQHSGLLLALMTADESLLSPATEAQFLRLGLSHLLAISGPHVLIFASLVCWALQRLIARYWAGCYLICPKPYILLLPFLACVLLYCAFVGFEIPALRTLLMCSLTAVFLLLGRAVNALTLLLYSASLLLFFDPLCVLTASFWLSYGACFILLRIYQTVQKQVAQPNLFAQLKKLLWPILDAQWKIFLALMPLVILFFKQISWISPMTNVIAIPFLGLLVVPLDVLAGLSFFIFEPLASFLLQINDRIIGVLLALLNMIEAIFSPQLHAVALNFWAWLALSFALILLFLPRGVMPKTWAALCLLPVFFGQQPADALQLQLLDVGQGQAIFIRQGKHQMMVDMGGNYDENKFSVGRQLILPFLSVNGIDQLETLVLTHLDQDHSGAYFSLQQQLKIKQIYSSEAIDSLPASTQFQYCRQGMQWQWDDQVEFKFLSPKQVLMPPRAEQRNEQSCVLYIKYKQPSAYQHILLMGDAGWPTEYQLLQDYPDLNVDVLVLGHHGSKHSSAYQFLQHYHPKLVLISAGIDNRYGHPSAEVKARLDDLGIQWYSTIEQGTLTLTPTASPNQQMLHMARQQKPWFTAPPDDVRH